MKQLKSEFTDFKKFCMYFTLSKKNIENYKDRIIEETSFLNEFYENFNITQRLYHIWTDTNTPLFCECGSPLKVSSVNYDKITSYYDFCKNTECRKKVINQKRRNTTLEQYGTANVAQCKKVQEKMKQTCLERYGVESALQSTEIFLKTRQTLKDRYGVDNPSQSDEIKKRKIDTCQKNLGVDFPMQSKEVLNKRKLTNIQKYGVEEIPNSSFFKEKSKKTLQTKYGVDNISKCDFMQAKKIETFLTKYGVKNPTLNSEIHEKVLVTNSKKRQQVMEDLLSSISEINIVDHDKYFNNFKIKCHKCNFTDWISTAFLKIRLHEHPDGQMICPICYPLKKFGISYMEDELGSFLHSLVQTDIQKNVRILDKKEIDFYIPELKIGFEFNGMYWHSDIFKKPSYHKDKKILALEKGINLIHIWEDDWNNPIRRLIVESRIKNILKKNSFKIFARNCNIVELDHKETKEFLEQNHIQGSVNSKWKYGLYFNGDLVSLMTLGIRNKNVELLRFANKLNCNVVGGFSRLFKHFLKEGNLNSDCIVSYADLDWTDLNNNVYLKNGFELDGVTKPGYFWSLEGNRFNRQKFQKHKLIEQGFDENLTEDQIMQQNGFLKVFNSGNGKFIYKIK
jgi:hypothetical protein